MVEQVFTLAAGNEKTVEKVILDENLHYLHMIFNKDEGTPEHFTNGNLYMTVLRGTLSICLADQDVHEYKAGSILKIPGNIKMTAKNMHPETLEITIVKAPAPKS